MTAKTRVKLLKQVYFICPECGTKAVRPLAWVKKSKTLLCSRKCNGAVRGREWAKHGHKGRAGWSQEAEARFKERMTGLNNPNWNGGRTLLNGYPAIWWPGHRKANSRGYVCEHIVVAEKKLGRPLVEGEVVHHIDGSKTNNDPSNLQIFPSNVQHLVEAHGLVAFAASR